MYRNLQFPGYWDHGLPHISTDSLPTISCWPLLPFALRTSFSWQVAYVLETAVEDSSTTKYC